MIRKAKADRDVNLRKRLDAPVEAKRTDALEEHDLVM